MARKDEKFSHDELTAIQSVLAKFQAGEIEFEYAAVSTMRLNELWEFEPGPPPVADISKLPESDYEVLEHRDERVFDRSVRQESPAHLYSLRKDGWFLGMSDEFIKAIQGIDRKLQGRILEAISYIGSKPTERKGDTVKPLGGELKGMWRYRIGDHRLVYQPDTESRRVLLVTFTSRAGAYN